MQNEAGVRSCLVNYQTRVNRDAGLLCRALSSLAPVVELGRGDRRRDLHT